MKISKVELLEDRLVKLEESYCLQSNKLKDLLEYLTRVDGHFQRDERHFADWHSRLEDLRKAEQVAQEIHQAKDVLTHYGYIVVSEESEIDAARMKQWLSSKATPPDDDDIPF